MQSVVPALHAARCGVGDVLPAVSPADTVSLALHQRDELVLGGSVPHTLVDGIDEPKLPALALGGGVVLSVGHGLDPFLLTRLEHRQAELHAHLIVALTQFCQLRFADVQLLSVLQTDAVDDEVRVDVVTIGVRADQHLSSLEIFRQFQRCSVSGDRIDVLTFGEALHHVKEHHTAILVVEQFGTQKIIVGTFRPTVNAADQPLILPQRFLLLHGVPHDRRHAGTALSFGVVGKVDDRYLFHLPRSWISRSVPLMLASSRAVPSRLTVLILPM